jgi:hypothetical protein
MAAAQVILHLNLLYVSIGPMKDNSWGKIEGVLKAVDMYMLRYRDIKGRQGDWLTAVTMEDGTVELLPTAHARFYDFKTGVYRREGHSMERFPGKLASWREQLCQTKKVVLTHDTWNGDGPPKRDGYIGVFDIADLELNETGAVHNFRVVGRYQKTGK